MGKRKYDEASEDASKKIKSDINSENYDQINGEVEQPQNEVARKEKTKSIKGLLFDVKHFRKELAGKQGQTMALTQFLQVCLNPDSDVDYMLAYLKVGGNSHEILRQISQDNKKNLTLATPTFHLFHLIILKVQSSLPHMITITEEACRYFLNTFVPTMEIMISENSGPRHRKIILKLLTSMVTLNSDLGVEILNQLPLTPKNLQHVVEKPNYKEKDNVRTAFVQFMTSFIVDGHLPLIKALLEKQGLLSLVIPGLVQDEADAVLMFLTILKKNVIDNILISKTLKLKTFSHQVLHNMFRIFSWKGPPETECSVEAKEQIMSLISEIIIALFTSHKLGLYFIDKSLGTSDVNKNPNLYKAIQSLKRPWENENQSEVLLEIMCKCPDLHRAIISVIEQNFQPQHSAIWQKTSDFVLKLMDTLKPDTMLLKLNNLNPLQTANFIRFITMPVPILKLINTGIGSDQTISLYSIKVLVKMLQTLKKYIQILELEDSNVKIVELKSKLDNFLPKHLPSPNTIVSLINNCIETTDTETSKEFRLPLLDKTDSLLTLIDLLLLYNYVYPTSYEVLEGAIDMKKVLSFSANLTTGNTSLLKFKVVSLWLILDSSALTLQNPMFKELFLIMLEVFTDDNDTWLEAKDTLHSFFKNTEIFEVDEDEIHLMLYTLRNSEISPISLVGDIVEHVLSNKQELTEHIRNQVVNFEISDENSQMSIDKLFNDLMHGKNNEDSVFLEKKLPSPFIVGCMQYIQNNHGAKKNLKAFLCLYVANLLHFNYCPELTEVLIGDSKLDVRSYLAEWTVKAVSVSETISKDETLIKISKIIIDNENLSLNNVFPSLVESTEEVELHISDISYRIDITQSMNSTDLFIWSKYLMFCVVRLTNMNLISTDQQKKIADCFKVIITLGKRHRMINTCRNIILNLFKNAHFLKLFQPVHTKKNMLNALATELLLQIIEDNKEIINYLDVKHHMLKSYRQKTFNDIVEAFIKIRKKKNVKSELTVRVLEIIGLNKKDDQHVFNQILSCDTEACVKEDKEPSLILELLRVLINKYSKSISMDLSNKTVTKSMTLYTTLLSLKEVTLNLTDLEEAFITYFENKPHQANHVNKEDFQKFFNANTVRKSTSQLAYTLLKFNNKFCNVFKEAINNPEVLSQREITLPLSNALCCHKQFLLHNKDILTKIYNEYKSNIDKFLKKPHKAGQVYLNSWQFIKKLIAECMDVKDCQEFYSKTQKFELVDLSHVNLIQVVFLKLLLNANSPKIDYLVNYFLTTLNITSIAIKEGKETILEELVLNINSVIQLCKTIEEFNTDKDFQKVTESAIWQSFCKSILKDSLKIRTANQDNVTGPKLLYLLSCLVKLFYPEGHGDVVTLFDMVTSHSEFLNVMLSYHSPDIKLRLLEFLFALMTKNKSVMKTQQIPVYLSSYRATRYPCDRLILTILQFYEINDLPVNDYKPYIWGDSAANHYAVRKSRTATLWSHPTPNQVMNLFDKDIIERTVTNFPVNQKMDNLYVVPQINSTSFKNYIEKTLQDTSKVNVKDTEVALQNLLLKEEYNRILGELKDMDVALTSHTSDGDNVYDPAFLFPLLGYLLAPGSIASCFKLLRSGLLSIPVMGLSSNCPLMRAAAYHVLHRFCLLLETETRHKNDKLLLSDFITTLRQSLSTAINGISNDGEFKGITNPKLPAIGALYLAKALMVSTSPSESLYKPVNNFLIAKQFVDFTIVPDFLSLFHDNDVESTDRRLWILDIIKDGTKTITDVTVIFKTMCLKMIMDFYNSVLCDKRTKVKILTVLNSIVTIPRGFEILVEGYGFISWLDWVIRNDTDKQIVKQLFILIENMIYSLSFNIFSKSCRKFNLNGNIEAMADFKIKSEVENEILNIIYYLLPHINFLDLDDIVSYVKLFNLITKRSIKCLTKQQVLNVVSVCSKLCSLDRVTLIHQAVVHKNAVMLCSKCLSVNVVSSEDRLIRELSVFVQNYVT